MLHVFCSESNGGWNFKSVDGRIMPEASQAGIIRFIREAAQTILVNTINYSQSWTPPFSLKTITIYSNNPVLVRFNSPTDPAGDRTHQIRASQSKSFDLSVTAVYLAKAVATDPDATVDIDGLA